MWGRGAVLPGSLMPAHLCKIFPIYLESSSTLSAWLTLALSCSSIICFLRFFQAELAARPL